jgi:hypothetical protein
MAVWIKLIFPHYLINDTTSVKMFFHIKHVF